MKNSMYSFFKPTLELQSTICQ